MNEEQKNIETCLPEDILAEVAGVPTDPQFVSLVNESLDPLKQQALQQAGYADYEKFAWPHKPYTFTSSVAQMKSNLILLLRRLWRFPFGRGTIRSLADMWQHYITRLQGNETYGIPSRLSSLTDLPSAPALLSDRKMVGGIGEEDGLSLAQALCGSYADVTALTDSNYGWTMGRSNFIATLVSLFPNLKDITLNCVEAPQLISNPAIDIHPLNLPYLEHTPNPQYVFLNGMEEWYLPKIKSFDVMTATAAQTANLKKMNFPDLESIGEGISYPDFFYQTAFPNLEEMYFPSLKYIHTWGTARSIDVAGETTKFWKLVLGKLEYLNAWSGGVWKVDLIQPADTHLVHVEIGAGTDINFSLANWNPTYALQNQLDLFLSNFRSFIILRLANRKTTSALTLTLSAAVYNAVTGADSGWASLHTLADLGITDNDLTDLETELGITTSTIYATWLDTYTGANGIHWNVNKAS
jgi:hypothetical protein